MCLFDLLLLLLLLFFPDLFNKNGNPFFRGLCCGCEKRRPFFVCGQMHASGDELGDVS